MASETGGAVMKQHSFQIRIITPGFVGGASQQAELRVPSLRGHVRWWFRALGADRLMEKNVFGGIMIIFDRAFQVGDKIQVGSFYGEVINIGLRSTKIVTADDSVVSIPNGEIMSQLISNSNTGETNCQVVSEIYLPPYIDIERTREIAIRSAQVSKYVFLNKPIAVIFKNEIFQNRSVLKMRLKAYVLDIRYEFAFMSEMTEIVLKELIKHGIVSKVELSGLSVN